MWITNEEEARRFYLYVIHNNSRYHEDASQEEIKAYRAHSSSELEKKWSYEKFEEYFLQIAPNNPKNLMLLREAKEWYYHAAPVTLLLEKLEILMDESGGDPPKVLSKFLVDATTIYINKSDKNEEQALFRLMELAKPYANEQERERMRLRIIGPESEEDAKWCYRTFHFIDDSRDFQTIGAVNKYERFATPENMMKWKQEYFDEWTGKDYPLYKELRFWVNSIELVSKDFGIYSRENMEKLYVKLSDYKNCADVDQYWKLVYRIKSNVFERLNKEGDYDLLKKFVILADDIYKHAPDNRDKECFLKDWNKENFLRDIPDTNV